MKIKRNILFQNWGKCPKAQWWKNFWFWLVIHLICFKDLSTFAWISNSRESTVRGTHFSVSISDSYIGWQVFSKCMEQLSVQILVWEEHLQRWRRARGCPDPRWMSCVQQQISKTKDNIKTQSFFKEQESRVFWGSGCGNVFPFTQCWD